MSRVAVLADIHSNAGALRMVIADAVRASCEAVWVAGDVFGYGMAACATWKLLDEVPVTAVLGNHDRWVLRPDLAPAGPGDGARANAATLAAHCPEALDWLARLPLVSRRDHDGWQVTMAHGTPADPLDGRYYPDDQAAYPWLPEHGEILILGQTHCPLLRGDGHRLLLNPGSVGQPRDGDPRPSWALLDTDTGKAELRRCQA